MIKVQSVRSKMLENDIAYVRVSEFQERTVEELVKNLRAARISRSLSLDLRNDPVVYLMQLWVLRVPLLSQKN